MSHEALAGLLELDGEWRDVISLVGSAFDLACLNALQSKNAWM